MRGAMRAAVYYRNDDVRVEEVARPRAGAGELLLQTRASGICGSDVMEWYRVGGAPRVLGHEVTGVVAEAGGGVENFRPGDRVSVTHHVPCNRCAHCLRGDHTACETLRATNFDPGGFSEFIRVPARNVAVGTFHLPDAVSDEEGVFIEPLGCVPARLEALADDAGAVCLRGGERRLRPAARPRPPPPWAPAPFSRRTSIPTAWRPPGGSARGRSPRASGWMRRCGRRTRAAWRIASFSAPARRPHWKTALSCVAPCGVVHLFAPAPPEHHPPVDVHRIWREQIAITATYGAAPLDLREAMALIRARRLPVEELITHRLPLGDAQEGFRLVARAGESLKVVLTP